MIKETVELMLACAENYDGESDTSIDKGMLAELARTWLRVNDASVESVGEDARGVPVIVAHGFNYGDRVRLVPEADSGGDRG